MTHIKLAGFKSFVEPTSIPVSQNLIGIVGPNGCGKSNIIDAVRWVLGESRASALRGDSLQDVIFAGSGQRKATSRASVEIIFDNQSGKAAGQWSSYAEISIKRVLQRDGVSNYYINNLSVRRRDISDLFLGTGVGGHGYAIIEQGMITRIIEARPPELKSYLEEAAGISQYRERRHETFTRLTETRRNLARLEDIGLELKNQLQHLATQAEKTQQYQSLQNDLHIAQLTLWLQRREEAINQHLETETELRKLESELDITVNNQHNAEAEHERLRTKEYDINEQLHRIQGQLYTAEAEISRLEQEITYLRNTDERITHQLNDIGKQLDRNHQNKSITRQNQAHWHQEKSKFESILAEHVLKNKENHNKLTILEARYSNCQEKLNRVRHDLLLAEQTDQLERSHFAHTQKNIRQLEERSARLIQEQNELVPIDSRHLAVLQTEILLTEKLITETLQKHHDVEIELTNATNVRNKIINEIHQLQLFLSQLTARSSTLLNLQKKLENNQDLDNWLKENQLQSLPRLWQAIQVHAEWEIALEAALRERLNSIALENLDKIQHLIEAAPPGNWTVFEKHIFFSHYGDQRHATNDRLNCNKLLMYVTPYQDEVRYILEDWLCNIYVAANLDEALNKKNLLNPGELLITPQGHSIARTSITFYAPYSQLHGVLSRQQEIAKLDNEINQLENQLQAQQELSMASEKQCVELTHALREMEASIQQTKNQHHNLQLEIANITHTAERTAHRNTQIHHELTEIKQALENETSLQNEANTKLIKNQQQIEELKKDAQHAQADWEKTGHILTIQKTNVQQSERNIQETTFQLKTSENKLFELDKTIQTIDETIVELQADHDKWLKEKSNLNETPLGDLLEVSKKQHQSIEQINIETRQEANRIAQCLREAGNIRLTSERKTYALRESISQIKLKQQAITISITQFNELINAVTIDPELPSPLIEKHSLPALQSKIDRLNTEINALGPVNLAAPGELAALQLRESDLLAQLQDLHTAIATLEITIQQIDREIQLRLKNTFDQVNHHLSETFSTIFTGGQARLEFCNEESPDAGLLLMAQPPGKKNNSIHLLSGGEKTLTALALIFSLFKLNPAPFCLLDEVDAPLDDNNTKRFCELVKKMASQTQFLFISHNKITMEIAQKLIGVTMQERGVSVVVSVDLADAIQMGKRIR